MGEYASHEQYRRLMAGPHRRPATPIGTPTLARHLCFWHRRPAVPVPRTGREDMRNADDALHALYLRLLGDGPPPRYSNVHYGAGEDHMVLFGSLLRCRDLQRITRDDPGYESLCAELGENAPDRFRALKLETEIDGFRLTIALEMHDETTNVSLLLDASWPGLGTARDARCPPGARLRPVFEALDTLVGIADNPAAAAAPPALRALHARLYEDAWARIDEWLALPSITLRLGDRIVDFRGIVLGRRDEDGPVPHSHRAGGVLRPLPDGDDGFMPKLDFEGQRPTVEGFGNLWPFLTCQYASEPDFTVSQVIDRALFAAALAPHPCARNGSVDYLCFLVYGVFSTRLQPGRLVYRINRAGRLRVAATMHFDTLGRISGLLGEAEAELEAAHGIISDREGSSDCDFNALLEDVRQCKVRIEQKISAADRLLPHESIEFRAERATYYVRVFHTVVESLRVKRVIGFQTYPEFVSQRLGGVFEKIEALGRRYQRIQEGRRLLLGRIQAIDSLVEQRLISHAQTAADIALWVALLPYYLGSILAHIVGETPLMKFIWVGLFVLGIAVAIAGSENILRALLRRSPTERQRKQVAMLFAIAGLALLVLAGSNLSGGPGHDAGGEASARIEAELVRIREALEGRARPEPAAAPAPPAHK